ncbi:hypothetical protein N9383_01355 [Granulosicoccus sp.]|nr:hypothetical protein [Granulosicoccus sp.]
MNTQKCAFIQSPALSLYCDQESSVQRWQQAQRCVFVCGFLHRNGRLLNARDKPVINDTGLAALTLLIAESDPKQIDVIIRLVMTMLALPEKDK